MGEPKLRPEAAGEWPGRKEESALRRDRVAVTAWRRGPVEPCSAQREAIVTVSALFFFNERLTVAMYP